jgi:hypothetical protein
MSKSKTKKKKTIKCSICGREHADLNHFHHEAICKPGTYEYEVWENTRSIASALRTFGPDDLFNLAKERQEHGEVHSQPPALFKNLRVDSQVKLSFLLKDKKGNWLEDEPLREMLKDADFETMFVKITKIDGEWPDMRYRGVLLNMPIFIHSRELTLGSEVDFTLDHVQPV